MRPSDAFVFLHFHPHPVPDWLTGTAACAFVGGSCTLATVRLCLMTHLKLRWTQCVERRCPAHG